MILKLITSSNLNMKIIILLLALMSLPLAAGQVTQSNLKVTKVMAGYSNGEVYFFVNKSPLNPKGCDAPKVNYNILAIDPARSDINQALSILLMAKATNMNVEVQIYDDYCFNNHAVIRRIALY